MEIIKDEIAKGKTSITRTIVAKFEGNKIKVSVKSDNKDYKCTATLYGFDNNAMTWNSIDSIAPSSMTTQAGLKNETYNDDVIIKKTQNDIDNLLNIATHLLD